MWFTYVTSQDAGIINAMNVCLAIWGPDKLTISALCTQSQQLLYKQILITTCTIIGDVLMIIRALRVKWTNPINCTKVHVYL